MTNSLILISDIHGSYYTLLRLLAKCAKLHPGARPVFVGDLIDRGPHSRKVVEFAMQNQIPTVMGNHEDLCLAYSEHTRRSYRARCSRFYDRDVWLFNGGEDALGNWPNTRMTDEGLPFQDGNRIPDDVLDWMDALPPYLTPEVELDSTGRRLLVSHTGYGLEADKDTAESWLTALWGRHGLDAPDFPGDGYYRVFGHTQRREPVVTDTYAMIDTGAAYVKRGMGTLIAFIWPSKEIVQQAFDETPVDLSVEMENGRIAA